MTWTNTPLTDPQSSTIPLLLHMSKAVILLTTANGKQCRHLIPFLLTKPDLTVRAFVHSEKSADQLKSDFNNPHNLETVIGD